MSNKIRILFVDDETNVLAALKRMLRSMRETWSMDFADSGAAALNLFKKKKYDVIVSDIRMPGMDGAELLNKVKNMHPEVIRIALSGQVDLNEVIRSIRAVHQYISKPCQAQDLINKIEGAVRARDILTDPKMQSLATELETLPVIPKVFQDVETELKLPEPSIERIANLISSDVGMVAKILKLVNSPYFGLPSSIDSIFQAITLLGLETIKALILSTHLFSMYDHNKLPNFSLTLLWEHSFRVSTIAKLIAECEKAKKSTVTEARMAGLLHDIGKLILASSFPEKYAEVIRKATQSKISLCQSEMEVFGTTHAQIGAYLMGLWGMSGEVVRGIGLHHKHTQYDMSVPMFLSVANTIDHHFVTIHPDYFKQGMTKGLLPEGRQEELLKKWVSYVKDNWSDMDHFNPIDNEALTRLFS
ncbi:MULTISPECIES: response regulator [unclassified Pseudodesulfovibrio]|uniref:response regulator n=1 Tax=unclassified Pseudodesulfovibrio TaxID=2661612 RepID=UPI000FEBBFF1|nr:MULTISPECIES: response regulator [unclassified Pseudodesulfovibrio]MCJ2164765.1 response regulator [Pseudodesulfovibrio sp. S3-i]RWU04049.1 HDOD domain-containing protein [Pseudodesulfovibrio sp. S3]